MALGRSAWTYSIAAVVAAGCVVAGVASAAPDTEGSSDDSTIAAAPTAQQARWGASLYYLHSEIMVNLSKHQQTELNLPQHSQTIPNLPRHHRQYLIPANILHLYGV